MEIRAYEDSDRASVVALWNEAFPDPAPHNDPALVIDQKTRTDDGLFFVACEKSRVVGTVMGGYDGHRGWVYTLAVAPGSRRNGVGRSLMQHLEEELRQRGCGKINLQVRGGNEAITAFYEQMGFSVEDRVSMGKLLQNGRPEC
jgi:ribosomal protein S18 acetylase RimI-like enzyme